MILGPDHPYNNVTGAISRGRKRGPATTIAPWHVPAAHNRRGIGYSDAESRQDRVAIVVGAERNIGALFASIGDGCLEDSIGGDLRKGYRATYPAQIVSIK